jgi:hypothetical protein
VKKLLFVLALALSALIPGAQAQGPIVGPGQYVLCTGAATLAVGPTTITQIIPISGTNAGTTKSIYICGWHITNTGATGTFTISTGTGSNCGTGTAVVVPATNVSSSAPSADHIDYASLQAPVGTNICVTSSVATISYVVYFNLF